MSIMAPLALAAIGTAAIGTAAIGVGLRHQSSARAKRPPTLQRAITTAMKTGAIDPIGDAVSAMAEGQQVNGINHAITRLWEGWERETAIRLIREVTDHIPEELIVQFWLRKSLEVEPDLAAKYFSDTFLLAYYKPDVARRCGTGGCCG